MKIKRLYSVGNLFSGYAWGVEAERQFGTRELHGPFSSENEADNYAHDLSHVRDYAIDGPYASLKVVRIETPQAGREIVYKDGAYSYPA